MKSFKRYFLFLVSFSVLLFSCQDDAVKQPARDTSVVHLPADQPTDVFTKVQTRDHIPAQSFFIRSEKDTTITGTQGTRLRVSTRHFVTEDGLPVNGPVQLELKEALKMPDIVLGNLVTMTAAGERLETGGMICVTATADGQRLRLADHKTIDAAVPAEKIEPGMQLFEGKVDSMGQIGWENPVALAEKKAEAPADQGNWVRWTNLDFQSTSPEKDKSISDEVNAKWMGFHRDTVVKIQDKRIKFFSKNREFDFEEFEDVEPDAAKQPERAPTARGMNYFSADANTNYIFALRKLGWANIDRLHSDPRTADIDFVMNVENEEDFSLVYVTLIVSNQNMYIPGYQKRDRTFSFTHGDYERTRLPVGEQATILATAYKNGKPYYTLRHVTIEHQMHLAYTLEKTTQENLKKALETEL